MAAALAPALRLLRAGTGPRRAALSPSAAFISTGFSPHLKP